MVAYLAHFPSFPPPLPSFSSLPSFHMCVSLSRSSLPQIQLAERSARQWVWAESGFQCILELKITLPVTVLLQQFSDHQVGIVFRITGPVPYSYVVLQKINDTRCHLQPEPAGTPFRHLCVAFHHLEVRSYNTPRPLSWTEGLLL